MRVLFSGSRKFVDPMPVNEALQRLARKAVDPAMVAVVHGGAPGLDSLVDALGRSMGMQVEVHRADWNTHGKAAGVLRNQKMVELGADMLFAYPLPDGRGTQDCIARAVAAGIPTLVYDAGTRTFVRM